MPYPRVLGDAVTLCDGTIGVFGGGERGIAVRATRHLGACKCGSRRRARGRLPSSWPGCMGLTKGSSCGVAGAKRFLHRLYTTSA